MRSAQTSSSQQLWSPSTIENGSLNESHHVAAHCTQLRPLSVTPTQLERGGFGFFSAPLRQVLYKRRHHRGHATRRRSLCPLQPHITYGAIQQRRQESALSWSRTVAHAPLQAPRSPSSSNDVAPLIFVLLFCVFLFSPILDRRHSRSPSSFDTRNEIKTSRSRPWRRRGFKLRSSQNDLKGFL